MQPNATLGNASGDLVQPLPTALQFIFQWLFVIVSCAILYYTPPIVSVSEGEQAVAERFGRFSRILTRGFNPMWPFFDRVRVVQWDRVVRKETRSSDGDDETRYGTIECEHRRFPTTHTIHIVAPRVYSCAGKNERITITASFKARICDLRKAVYSVEQPYAEITAIVQRALEHVVRTRKLSDCVALKLQKHVTEVLRNLKEKQEIADCGMEFHSFSIDHIDRSTQSDSDTEEDEEEEDDDDGKDNKRIKILHHSVEQALIHKDVRDILRTVEYNDELSKIDVERKRLLMQKEFVL
jgi:regulator of protease activity HflC (stomatin/prohibitin superfamily)